MERKIIGDDDPSQAGLRARAQTAWSGLMQGFGWRARHPAVPPPRLVEHVPSGEPRRDCRRCAADFERAMLQVEAANTAKSRFLATVSHELRTPLNAIIGFSQIIRDDLRRNGQPTALHADFAQEIYDSGVHLMEIINEILELANIESGRRPLVLEEIDLGRLFELCVLKVSSSASARGVTVDTDKTASAISLVADRALVRQIVEQLLSNAIKFNRRGGWVRLNVETIDDSVIITVADSGIGIAVEDLGKAFHPFWQAAAPVSREYDGAGLGLTLVKAAAEAMGGEVLIDSRLGAGVRVRVALPLRQAAIDGTTEVAAAEP